MSCTNCLFYDKIGFFMNKTSGGKNFEANIGIFDGDFKNNFFE